MEAIGAMLPELDPVGLQRITTPIRGNGTDSGYRRSSSATDFSRTPREGTTRLWREASAESCAPRGRE